MTGRIWTVLISVMMLTLIIPVVPTTSGGEGDQGTDGAPDLPIVNTLLGTGIVDSTEVFIDTDLGDLNYDITITGTGHLQLINSSFYQDGNFNLTIQIEGRIDLLNGSEYGGRDASNGPHIVSWGDVSISYSSLVDLGAPRGVHMITPGALTVDNGLLNRSYATFVDVDGTNASFLDSNISNAGISGSGYAITTHDASGTDIQGLDLYQFRDVGIYVENATLRAETLFAFTSWPGSMLEGFFGNIIARDVTMAGAGLPFLLTDSDLDLRDTKLTNHSYEIKATRGSLLLVNSTIYHMVPEATGGIGIWVKDGDLVVEDSRFTWKRWGLYVWNSTVTVNNTYFWPATNPTLNSEGTTGWRPGLGIFAFRGSDITVTNSTFENGWTGVLAVNTQADIHDNQFRDNYYSTIVVDSSLDNYPHSEALIYDNIYERPKEYAIYIRSNGTVRDNLITDVQGEIYQNAGIIAESDFPYTYILNNTLSGGNGTGIRLLPGSRILVAGNTVSDYRVGIMSLDGSACIRENTVSTRELALAVTGSDCLIGNVAEDARVGILAHSPDGLVVQANTITNVSLGIESSPSLVTELVNGSSYRTTIGFDLGNISTNSSRSSFLDALLNQTNPTSILLVDDDAGANQEVLYLTSLGNWTVTLYQVNETGSPSLANLTAHDLVIWQTGNQVVRTLDLAEMANLTTYTAGGGDLVLAGSSLAWSLADDPAGQTFLADVMGVRVLSKVLSANLADTGSSWAAGYGTLNLIPGVTVDTLSPLLATDLFHLPSGPGRVLFNTFTNASVGGHEYEPGLTWSLATGNHWSDLVGPDANGDGIVDIPKTITGWGAQDPAPYVAALTPTVVDIPVVTGWNLLSLPANLSGAIDILFDDLCARIPDTTWDRAWWFDGVWSSFQRARPAFMNDRNVTSSTGIWLNISQTLTGNLTVAGPAFTRLDSFLAGGWNLIGWPGDTPVQMAIALTGVAYDSVEMGDPGSTYGLTTMAPTDLMQPYGGYWVHVTSAGVWSVDG